MQNLLPDARYTINFIGKDKDKLVDMLSIIGSDKTARFHNGRWSVLGGTLSSIIAVVDKSLLDIKEEIELGTELQSGYKLYPFQKDIVEFCIARNGSLIAAACGTGKTIIMISEELPELIGMSDRILILKDGQFAGEFTRGKDMNENSIIEVMI